MELLQEHWMPLLVSNCLGLLILWAAMKRTRLARLFFVLLFGWASWLNFSLAHDNPTDYLPYGSMTPFSAYEDFINGWFAGHITEMVTAISIGQAMIAIGMLLKGNWVRVAGVGAIVFFLAITPLGIGSGFPFPLVTAISAWFILKRDTLNYLWNGSKPRYLRHQSP